MAVGEREQSDRQQAEVKMILVPPLAVCRVTCHLQSDVEGKKQLSWQLGFASKDLKMNRQAASYF
jgi:hypothetical protein